MHLYNEHAASKTDGAADGFTDWAPWTVWVKQPCCSGKMVVQFSNKPKPIYSSWEQYFLLPINKIFWIYTFAN